MGEFFLCLLIIAAADLLIRVLAERCVSLGLCRRLFG